MGTVDRWHVYTGIDHHNDGVVDDYAGGGESGDGGGDHTLYLSFFLHGQNFWRIKFTPKNANFSR